MPQLPRIALAWGRAARRVVSHPSAGFLVVFLWSAPPSAGQRGPVRLPYVLTCPACRIEFEREATFGSASDPVTIGRAVTPVRDGRGRYVAVAAYDRQLVVFDSTGRFLRALGRRGDGPGEFAGQITNLFVAPGDTLVVFHQPAQISLFDSDLQFVRRVQLPPGRLVAGVAAPGGFVVSEVIPTPDQIGFPYHMVARDGSLVNSFGAHGGAIVPGTPPPDPPKRFAWAGATSSLWISEDTAFVLEEWGLNGTRRTRLEFTNVPWLRAPTFIDTVARGRSVRVMRPPEAGMAVSGIDSQGRVWINSFVSGTGDPAHGHPSHYAVEIVDPVANRVLLAQPVERPIRGPFGDRCYTAEEHADGIVTFTVWRVAVHAPPPE